MMEKGGHIFISYSSKDAALANQVVAFLEQNGYLCWIAPRNITSGGDYTDMINDSIHDCRAVVVIVTARSVQSQWVKKELTTAVSYDKTIIPFRTAEVELNSGLKFVLNNVQWIDATAGSVTSHFPQIVNGIEQQTVMAGPAPDPDPHKHRWVVPAAVAAVLLAGVSLLVWHPWAVGEAEPVDSVVPQAAQPPVKVVDTVVVEVPVPQPVADSRKTETKTSTAAKTKSTETATAAKTAGEVPTAVPTTETPAAAPTAEASQPKKVHTPTAAELAEENYNRQFKKGKRLYDVGNYKDALAIFTSLKYEKPSDASLDAYIAECRKHL